MTDSHDGLPPQEDSLQMNVLAHLMKAHQTEAAEMLEVLAPLLETAIPDKVKVERSGWPWSKKKPVHKLHIHFAEVGFEITKDRHGAMHVIKRNIVRGITLKTSEISMEDCIKEIMTNLDELAKKSENARYALEKFVWRT